MSQSPNLDSSEEIFVTNELIRTQLFSMWQTKLQHQVAAYILITTIDKSLSDARSPTSNLQLIGLITLHNEHKTS